MKDLVVHFKEKAWNKGVAYLNDIFDLLNYPNLKIQGWETHVLFFQDILRAFVSKRQYLRRKSHIGSLDMFVA